MSQFPTGVVIVTGLTYDGEPTGMVIGSFTSVSLDPPLVGFFPTKISSTFASMETSAGICINVLSLEQEELCRRFASRVSDKFEGVEWHRDVRGLPRIERALLWLDCDVHEITPAGDHYLVLALVKDAALGEAALPLLFFQGDYGKFSSRRVVPAGHPDVLRLVKEFENVPPLLDDLAHVTGGQPSVVAAIDSELVVVAESRSHNIVTVGSRFPFLAPMGAVLLPAGDDLLRSRWLMPYQVGNSDEQNEAHAKIEAAHARGYSLALRDDASEKLLMEAWERYSSENRTPMQERAFRNVLAEHSELYDPTTLDPNRRYDLRSLLVPLEPAPSGTVLGLRLGALPGAAPLSQIEIWVEAMRRCASTLSSQQVELTG